MRTPHAVSHNADNIAYLLKETMGDVRMHVNGKVVVETTDEGSNFVSAVALLKTARVIQDTLPCMAHMLHTLIGHAVFPDKKARFVLLAILIYFERDASLRFTLILFCCFL
jgi:hypothetical protein